MHVTLLPSKFEGQHDLILKLEDWKPSCFRRRDVPNLIKYLNNHLAEFKHADSSAVDQVTFDPFAYE